jgi:hypothetical protein
MSESLLSLPLYSLILLQLRLLINLILQLQLILDLARKLYNKHQNHNQVITIK